MELTQNQKLLINGLQLLKIKQRIIEVIMLACQTEEATTTILNYITKKLENKEQITEEMLLNQIAQM